MRGELRMTNSMTCANFRTMNARRPIIRPVREVRADANIDPTPIHPILIRLSKIHDVRARRPFITRDKRIKDHRMYALYVQHVRADNQCARPWTGGASFASSGGSACFLANACSKA